MRKDRVDWEPFWQIVFVYDEFWGLIFCFFKDVVINWGLCRLGVCPCEGFTALTTVWAISPEDVFLIGVFALVFWWLLILPCGIFVTFDDSNYLGDFSEFPSISLAFFSTNYFFILSLKCLILTNLSTLSLCLVLSYKTVDSRSSTLMSF